MLEALVVVGCLLSFFSPLIISKFLVPGEEDIGGFSKLKLGLPELVEGFIGFLLGLLQRLLGSFCMLFHYI